MKIIKALLISLLSILFLSCIQNINPRPDYEQHKLNSSLTTATLELPEGFKNSSDADYFKMTCSMYNLRNEILFTDENTFTYDKVINGTFEYDFKYHGIHQITLEFYKDDLICGNFNFEYQLSAPSYNIANFTATVPVSYFSLLEADSDNSTYIDSNIISYVSLQRGTQYNWDELLPNMKNNPFVKKEIYANSTETGSTKYFNSILYDAMKDYVKYLHDLNPDSTFNLVINDLDVDMILSYLFENGIDKNHCTVTMITDGTATYAYFRKCFGDSAANDDSLSIFNKMKTRYDKLSRKSLSGDTSYRKDINFWDKGNISRRLIDYAVIAANDPELNIKWIINRKNKDTFGETQAANNYILSESNLQAKNNIVTLNLYNLYNNLNNEEKYQIKNLLNLEVDSILEAKNQGKKPMAFLGTRNDIQNCHLMEYLDFIKQYFGDEYAFFYKGHPGDASNFTQSERIESFEKIGIKVLDASIPAEFFYFFVDGLYYVGYQSSTFNNIENQYKSKLLANITEEAHLATKDVQYTSDIYISFDAEKGKYKITDKINNKTGYWTSGTSINTIIWE